MSLFIFFYLRDVCDPKQLNLAKEGKKHFEKPGAHAVLVQLNVCIIGFVV